MRFGLWRTALSACCLIAAFAASTAVASAAYDAQPTDGTGTATATGRDFLDRPFTATLTSGFSPSHIQPGQPFTFTGKLVADVQDPTACPAGTTSQTGQYDSWAFQQVGPGEDFPTEGSRSSATLATNFSYTSTTDYLCPDERLTGGPMVVPVSADQSASLAPGCYQSEEFLSALYFPQQPGDPTFDSLSGTIGTIRVGDGPDCAKPGAGTEIKTDELNFGSDGTSSLPISCGFLSDPCKGKATVNLLPPHHGRAGIYPRCTKCRPVAVGPYSVQPGSSGKAKLELTKFGEKALGRGGHCKNCGRQVARAGRVQYPRCGRGCMRVVVTTKDTRTGGKTRQKVLLRGGKCHNCKRVMSPRPAQRRSLRAPSRAAIIP
jgi:hypothetical protein